MATLAPSAARRLAIAAPMPREPPVTSAIFPSNFFAIVLLLYALQDQMGHNEAASFEPGQSTTETNCSSSRTKRMLVRHESKFCRSLDASQAHLIRCLGCLAVASSKDTL